MKTKWWLDHRTGMYHPFDASDIDPEKPICRICDKNAYFNVLRAEYSPGCDKIHEKQSMMKGDAAPRILLDR